MKKKYKFIFCIVIYRNYEDIKELIVSIKKSVKENYRIIIVNNYYDDESKNIIFEIAKENGCDFINSENNGYGSGNNLAINFAIENYQFNYIVISNPDIIIKKFDTLNLTNELEVIAPQVITINGKKQNPMCVYDNKFIFYLIYKGLKINNKIIFFIGIVLNKLLSQINYFLYEILDKFGKKKFKIYMAHGSFVIIGKEVINKLVFLYDKKMFLFAEEGYLAWKLKKFKINTYYTPNIRVVHKEDGSMKFIKDINKHLKESNLYFYETYYRK